MYLSIIYDEGKVIQHYYDFEGLIFLRKTGLKVKHIFI